MLGVIGGFITPALPVTAGYEGRWPSFVSLPLVRQVFVVMEQLMNFISSDVTEPQHYGSQCVYKAQWHARQVMHIILYSLLMRVNKSKKLYTCVGPP